MIESITFSYFIKCKRLYLEITHTYSSPSCLGIMLTQVEQIALPREFSATQRYWPGSVSIVLLIYSNDVSTLQSHRRHRKWEMSRTDLRFTSHCQILLILRVNYSGLTYLQKVVAAVHYDSNSVRVGQFSDTFHPFHWKEIFNSM